MSVFQSLASCLAWLPASTLVNRARSLSFDLSSQNCFLLANESSHQTVMNVPRPQTESKSGSFVPLVLAFLLAGAVIAALSLLTMGFVGVIVAVVIGLAAFIAVQYLIWGWWLGNVIRDDVDSEREDESNS